MHASIIDGQILTTGSLPTTARRTDTGAWVLNLTDAPVELREACGWYEVIDVERPPDTDTTTFDRTVELVDGTPTIVWTEVQKPEPPPDPEPAVGLAAQVETLTAQVDALLTAQAGVDPAVMAQLVTLGATLVGSADQLQSALTAVSGSNTAKAPLQIVNAAVQAAADT